MGYARIVSGGEDGRYTIELDSGSETQTAVLAHLAASIERLDENIVATQAKIDETAAEEAARRAAINESIAQYIAAVQAGGVADPAQFTYARRYYAELQFTIDPLKVRMAALKAAKAEALRLVTYWTEYDPLQYKQAWCVDFTEDASGYVATCDIPGESDLTLIAPGGREWQESDGVMVARRVCSPEQAYWNAAALPGWQKWLPTHRWGTLTAIDYVEGTCTVELGSATSSAQRLPVNQASTLTNVPIVYMDCNSAVFEIDDNVVVEFTGQDWNSPKVIGFLDHPRPCDWPCFYSDSSFGDYFRSRNPQVFGRLLDESPTVEGRMNRGDWETFTVEASGPGYVIYKGPDVMTRPGYTFYQTAIPPAGYVTEPPVYNNARVIIMGAGVGGGPAAPASVDAIRVTVPKVQDAILTDHYVPTIDSHERDTYEIRISLGSQLVFNVACADHGLYLSGFGTPALNTDDAWAGSGSVKCLSGIGPLLSGSESCTELDYDLYVETGD